MGAWRALVPCLIATALALPGLARPANPSARKPALAPRSSHEPAQPAGLLAAAAREAAAREARAARLAATGRRKEAFAELARAHRALRDAEGRALRALPPPAPNPAGARELAELRRWMAAEQRRVAGKPAEFRAALAKYRLRKQALERKYGAAADARAVWRRQRRELLARFALLRARLEDRAADLHARAGNAAEAASARQRALLERMRAGHELGRTADAVAAAGKLARVPGGSAPAYAEAGSFLMEQRRFDVAAVALEAAVEAARAGRSPTARLESRGGRRAAPDPELPLLYRQLAFCYTKLGRKEDAERALRRAAEAERGG